MAPIDHGVRVASNQLRVSALFEPGRYPCRAAPLTDSSRRLALKRKVLYSRAGCQCNWRRLELAHSRSAHGLELLT
jgi:hypothetical protein